MRYQRTQVYLDPEEHRRLVKEARERGLSLAALIREIVSEHVRERTAPYETKGFDAIIGIAGDDKGPTDVAEHIDKYLGEALEARYLEETAWLRRSSRGAKRRRRR